MSYNSGLQAFNMNLMIYEICIHLLCCGKQARTINPTGQYIECIHFVCWPIIINYK